MDKTNLKDKRDFRISVAPMMGWTDKHDRYFLRLISPNIWLYTVMITTGALIHGDAKSFLDFNEEEHPLALQLGGSNPEDLGICAKMAEEFNYDEVNLNCGCPSDRVQRGDFGACLMAQPKLVADGVDAMKQSCDIPVTVKTRIGIDEQDDYGFVRDFVGTVAEKGCGLFIIHARKAWLHGLSPKENRTVPPLKWDTVYQLKQDFPDLAIELNGGVQTIDHINEVAPHTDGVMIGREAYQNPYFLADIERMFYNNISPLTRHEVIDRLKPYIEQQIAGGVPLKDITRHILGLYQGIRGARHYRRVLSEQAYKEGKNSELLDLALSNIKL
jgi:tRNA-dihydrouridine synthase A